MAPARARSQTTMASSRSSASEPLFPNLVDYVSARPRPTYKSPDTTGQIKSPKTKREIKNTSTSQVVPFDTDATTLPTQFTFKNEVPEFPGLVDNFVKTTCRSGIKEPRITGRIRYPQPIPHPSPGAAHRILNADLNDVEEYMFENEFFFFKTQREYPFTLQGFSDMRHRRRTEFDLPHIPMSERPRTSSLAHRSVEEVQSRVQQLEDEKASMMVENSYLRENIVSLGPILQQVPALRALENRVGQTQLMCSRAERRIRKLQAAAKARADESTRVSKRPRKGTRRTRREVRETDEEAEGTPVQNP